MDDRIARILAAENLDAALAIVLDVLVDLLGGERAVIALRDATTGELTFYAGRGLDAAAVAADEFDGSWGAMRQAAATGETLLTTNAAHEPRLTGAESASFITYDVYAIATAPLIIGGETVGALYADRRLGRGRFPATIEATMTAFSEQAGAALARFWAA